MVLRIAKIIVALGFLGLVLWKLPILEILYHSAVFVLIPLFVLGAVGVISKESLNLLFSGASTLRAQIDAERERLHEMYEEYGTIENENPSHA